MENQLYTLHTLSPLHCGIGQGLNDIDLPTKRSQVTGHPIVPESSLKGVLKDEFKEKYPNTALQIQTLFGDEEVASAITIEDALLLTLPIRSFFGTFTYLASPTSLRQLKSLFNRIDKKCDMACELPKDENSVSYQIQVCTETVLTDPDKQWVLLEDLDLAVIQRAPEEVEATTATNNTHNADQWATIIAPEFFDDEEGIRLFKKHFAIVDDDIFDFLCDTALQVDAKISIDDDTGTTKDGSLRYEESVPREALFIGLMTISDSRHQKYKSTADDLVKVLCTEESLSFQIGGKATTGKGQVALNFIKKDD